MGASRFLGARDYSPGAGPSRAIDEGPPTADPVLVLHGEPSAGEELGKIVADFAGRGAV